MQVMFKYILTLDKEWEAYLSKTTWTGRNTKVVSKAVFAFFIYPFFLYAHLKLDETFRKKIKNNKIK